MYLFCVGPNDQAALRYTATTEGPPGKPRANVPPPFLYQAMNHKLREMQLVENGTYRKEWLPTPPSTTVIPFLVSSSAAIVFHN